MKTSWRWGTWMLMWSHRSLWVLNHQPRSDYDVSTIACRQISHGFRIKTPSRSSELGHPIILPKRFPRFHYSGCVGPASSALDRLTFFLSFPSPFNWAACVMECGAGASLIVRLLLLWGFSKRRSLVFYPLNWCVVCGTEENWRISFLWRVIERNAAMPLHGFVCICEAGLVLVLSWFECELRWSK